MKLAGIGRVLLVVAAVFVAVWLCVILYWRSSGATPGGTQMLLLLGVLPVGLLGGIWLLRRARASRAGAAPAEEPKAVAAASGDETTFEATPPLHCLAAALWLPCGDDAGQVLAALPAPQRPGLHPKFRDRDGLPVFTAHVERLETEGFADTVAASAEAGRQLDQDEERVRALALLEPVATELFDAAALLLPPLPVAEERVIAGLRRTEGHDVRVAVRVHALLPMSWETPLRQAVADWLLELALASGIDRRRIVLDVVPADGAVTAWGLLDAIAGGTADGEAWHLVLACDSLVGERSVQRLIATGRLMDSRRSEGVVPGEGAAGVLLRPSVAPEISGSGQDPAQAVALHRASRAVLAAGMQPRAAARSTGELMSLALRRADVEADAVALVLTDADQRPSRAVEASAGAAAACPELDISTQCGALGVPCGETGHVAPIALLALGTAQVRASMQAVLLLSLGAGLERMAAVIAPQAPEDRSPEQAGDAPAAAT
ncbi:hypothetical protein [Luteimonas lutimaris]|uniref:3-oxoacyl-ACP synthase n=1 Tax=Luteimonas lutimaris TaxID=698645 RepID=A0ABP7MVW1_9GAMM